MVQHMNARRNPKKANDTLRTCYTKHNRSLSHLHVLGVATLGIGRAAKENAVATCLGQHDAVPTRAGLRHRNVVVDGVNAAKEVLPPVLGAVNTLGGMEALVVLMRK